MLSMKAGFALLDKYGIPTAKFAVVKRVDAAAKAAKKIGYPVAVKIDSPDIVHKTERGVVAANLKDEAELRAGVKRVLKRAGKARVRGIIVQEHCSGKEVIIGGTCDAQFGDVVLFGLGGIFVEVLKDFSVRVTPITRRDAKSMVKEIRGYPLLAGTRGEKPVAIPTIVNTIIKASRMLEREPKIKELDINPLFVDEKGVKAADVRVITY
ncbi:MAG: acetate--CoA ligase family protein [Candidatus Diapherotrites archaeon]|nr:acetate--CoA ligase family protein [Candidatus Diapherotrites archaeon]